MRSSPGVTSASSCELPGLPSVLAAAAAPQPSRQSQSGRRGRAAKKRLRSWSLPNTSAFIIVS